MWLQCPDTAGGNRCTRHKPLTGGKVRNGPKVEQTDQSDLLIRPSDCSRCTLPQKSSSLFFPFSCPVHKMRQNALSVSPDITALMGASCVLWFWIRQEVWLGFSAALAHHENPPIVTLDSLVLIWWWTENTADYSRLHSSSMQKRIDWGKGGGSWEDYTACGIATFN